MREPFLERIEKRVMVCDGAMGTMLYSRGIALGRCFDELNLSAPQLIKDVHVAYLKAGAEIIETNTFGANRFRLDKFGYGGKTRDVNLAGVRLAREAAGEDLYVAGAVGPLDIQLEPLGPISYADARAAFREQIAALLEGGVDLIVIETMMHLGEAHQALLAARDAGSVPVVVQLTVQNDGNTPTGTRPEEFGRALDEWGADVIGINCSVGPAAVHDSLERLATVTNKKLSAQPNAGLPQTVGGRNLYLCSPEYMAGYAKRFIEMGARLLGGCCGTTPDHIRAIKGAVRQLTPRRTAGAVQVSVRPARRLDPVPLPGRSRLAAKLANQEFSVLVEVIPPKGCDAAKEIDGAQYLLQNGVDAISIPDGSGATARMSALALAAILQARTGIEVVLHYSARDRSVLTIQSDLLGAHALGLRNLLAQTREAGQYANPLETGIPEVDAIGLVKILNNFNQGLDVGDNPLGQQTAFLAGVSINPCAVNQEEELRRFRSKVEAGADFALTQPIFAAQDLAKFLEHSRDFAARLPVIASIWPLTSFRNAEFLNNEVPGISVPPQVMERMRQANAGERARLEGSKIAQETLQVLRPLVQGVQISAPFGRYDLAIEVAQAHSAGALSTSVRLARD